ncbi:hypothetical protein CEXT_455401 [Caerostris extrusa]|uniref:Uncharacterized protein n=1 Tax=Caerostris extrusa TaxID=172846 RepID=A0AAV4QS35_CAEEX|nr:hypothetical protein CEXT_455401 [Caerostris extrusa]
MCAVCLSSFLIHTEAGTGSPSLSLGGRGGGCRPSPTLCAASPFIVWFWFGLIEGKVVVALVMDWGFECGRLKLNPEGGSIPAFENETFQNLHQIPVPICVRNLGNPGMNKAATKFTWSATFVLDCWS